MQCAEGSDDLVTDSRQVEQGLRVVDVHGDLDLSTLQSMNQAVDAVLSKRPRALALDLSDVPFVDSSALAALVEASRKLEHQGAYLAVLRPQRMPRLLLERTSLDRVLLVAESIAEARARAAELPAAAGQLRADARAVRAEARQARVQRRRLPA